MCINKTSKHNTIGKGFSNRSVNGGNDSYFTDPKYAYECCITIQKLCYRFDIEYIVEPSAGNASFYEGLKVLFPVKCKGIFMYDISPASELVEKKDFFDIVLTENTLVVGNPPFGFASNLAIKFFNHAAKYNVKLIAFILPRTFKKDSVKDKLNNKYILIYEEDCPKNSFIVDGSTHDVPTVFQIWRFSNIKRPILSLDSKNKWIEFTTPDKADFCLRRVGGKAGQILDGDPHSFSKESTYFCREKIKGVKDVLHSIDFSEFYASTVGVRSLSKSEIHKALNKYYGGLNSEC